MASISPANVLSSMSHKTWISVFQVTGCLPFPATHSSMISILISFASFICLRARARIFAPLWSSSRRRPNSRYLTPISWGMLILLFLPRNLMHSINVGWSPWTSIGEWSIGYYYNLALYNQSFSYHKMSIPFHYQLFFHYHCSHHCPHHCPHHCFHHFFHHIH